VAVALSSSEQGSLLANFVAATGAAKATLFSLISSLMLDLPQS
jgi:ABC-type enterochelin transport system ATPase subunit